jgi:RNA polymerase sigma-70 factor (ECF subfamily)
VAQRAAWLVTGSAEEAADAAQEGFVKAWQALARFHDGVVFRPWLLRIVVNTARNRRRAAWRFDAMRLRAEAQPQGEVMSPEGAAISRAEHDAVVVALRRLGTRDREVVACRYLLQLSEAETAAVLGCAPGTVKSRLSRALGRLRGDLDLAATADVGEGGA